VHKLHPRRLLPLLLTSLTLASLLAGCAGTDEAAQREENARARAENLERLRAQIAPELTRLGARNWIVIADPTLPVLAGAGVQVLPVEANNADTLREVLDQLELQAALVPRLWVSRELTAIPENRAPGVHRYTREMKNLIRGRFHYYIDQRFIDMQLAQAAANYRVLYLKTNTHLPYSSIAIELDSGYWNPDAEAEIRQRLNKLTPPIPPIPSSTEPTSPTPIAVPTSATTPSPITAPSVETTTPPAPMAAAPIEAPAAPSARAALPVEKATTAAQNAH